MNDPLFHGNGDLYGVLRAHTEKMKLAIGEISAERVNGAIDEELVDHFVSEYRIETLTIHADHAEAEHRETKIDVSHDRLRFMHSGRGPVMVKGDEVTIHVPFTGEPVLFKFTPSTYNVNPPRGRVIPKGELAGTATITLALPSDANDADRFNAWIKEQLRGLQEYADWIRNDVTGFNQQLPQHARSAVQARRQQLERQGALLQKLAIPLRPREGAPSPTPIPMPKKIVKPLPPARKVEQEYGISEADYEYILKIIRQESRSFESTPATFAKLCEEELRDIVLAHLNGHFNGDATGERFRKKGKTDICIEHDNRAAFVAECKLWKGPKALNEAVDQLLGYLTWRDTRTALIIWNIQNKDFTKLQGDMPNQLRGHGRYLRTMDAGHAGEWRAVFRSESDDNREVLVHVFLVDLNVSGRAAKT
jgi:hypothetical protein